MDTPGLERLKTLHLSDSVTGLNDLIKADPRSLEGNLTDQTEDDGKPNTGLHELAQEFLEDNPIDAYNSKIFVGNISFKVREKEFREFFKYFGKVLRVQILKDKKTRKSRGIGFVTFSNPLESKRALDAKPFELSLDGRVMKVEWAQRRKSLKAHREQDTQNREEKVKEIQNAALKYHSSAEAEQKKDIEVIQDQSLINRLDDDCLSYILSFINLKQRIVVERVCKRWRVMAMQGWRHVSHVDFDGIFEAFQGTGGLTDRILISVLKKTRGLKSLDLSHSPYLLSPHGLENIAACCPDLRFLNLSKTTVSSSCLKKISDRCQKLKVVILDGCRDLGEKGLWWLLKSCRQIEHLRVTESIGVTGQCFHFFGPSLSTLELIECNKVSDTALKRLAGAEISNLRRLNISGCKTITTAGLSELFQHCNNVRELEVCQTSYFDCERGLQDINLLSSLERLNLSTNNYVTDDVLVEITRSCHNLRRLNIEACHSLTTKGFETLSKLTNLEFLNVSYQTQMTDQIVQLLAAEGYLRSFTARACTQLSNEALVSLLLYCEKLVEMDFSSCYLVKDTLTTDDRLTALDPSRPRVSIYIGGTSLSKEAAVSLEKKLEHCSFIFDCRTLGMLRNDKDPSACAPFYPSDSEDDDFFSCGKPEHYGLTLRANDFLENDDPTVLEDYCDDDVYFS